MKREELKKEFTERIKNYKREFTIEKISLSKNDPILQSARKIGGVGTDYLVKRAEERIRPRTPEEMEDIRGTFGYPGRKSSALIKYIESPGKYYGFKIGRFRFGVWIENEQV